MSNNMSLSDKYKREAKRNANLTKRMAVLLNKLGEQDKLIVKQDFMLGERNLEIAGLKEEIRLDIYNRK